MKFFVSWDKVCFMTTAHVFFCDCMDSFLISVHSLHPQLFIFRAIKADGVDFTQCVTHGSFPYPWQKTAYNMFHFVTLYVFPLLVMTFCYTCILISINGQMHKSKGVLPRSSDGGLILHVVLSMFWCVWPEGLYSWAKCWSSIITQKIRMTSLWDTNYASIIDQNVRLNSNDCNTSRRVAVQVLLSRLVMLRVRVSHLISYLKVACCTTSSLLVIFCWIVRALFWSARLHWGHRSVL